MTSRNQLAGLVAADGAHPLTLDLLPDGRGARLLARRLGARPDRRPSRDAVGRDHRPVRAAAAGAGDRRRPRRAQPARARSRRSPPSCARRGPASTRSTPGTRHRRPGGVLLVVPRAEPAGRAAVPAAAACTRVRISRRRRGQPRRSAGRRGPAAARRADRAHLVTEPQPGRYAFHDLLRAYAGELAATAAADPSGTDGGPTERDAAVTRLLAYYAASARHATEQVEARDWRPVLPPLPPGVTPDRPDDLPAAQAWLTAELLPALEGLLELAAAGGYDGFLVALAVAANPIYDLVGLFDQHVRVVSRWLAAAQRLGDLVAQAAARLQLGFAHIIMLRLDEAREHLRHALDRFTEAGDLVGVAETHRLLSHADEYSHRYDGMLDHALRSVDLYSPRRRPERRGARTERGRLGARPARRVRPGTRIVP